MKYGEICAVPTDSDVIEQDVEATIRKRHMLTLYAILKTFDPRESVSSVELARLMQEDEYGKPMTPHLVTQTLDDYKRTFERQDSTSGHHRGVTFWRIRC